MSQTDIADRKRDVDICSLQFLKVWLFTVPKWPCRYHEDVLEFHCGQFGAGEYSFPRR